MCAEVSHPAVQTSIPGVKLAPVPQGVGSENGSSIQDGIGEWLLESRWSWHPHAQQTPHHVQRCCASHCNLEHKKCNCSGGGRVGGTPAPHPSSRLTADNWIRNSPVHVCSRAGVPNLWTTGQDLLSDEQQHWIRSKVRNKCNALEPSPNHPPTPGSWKNGLPWNWFLCHEGWGPLLWSEQTPLHSLIRQRTELVWARLPLVLLAPMTHEQQGLCMLSH